jgi:acyl-CoA dehydrogenase
VGNLIGAENMGFACIMGNFQSERLALALMANMTSQLALEEALKWAREREAFGKPIGKFQVIKHRLAEMATALEVSREFTYRQAAKMAAGQSVIKEISMAKNVATDTSTGSPARRCRFSVAWVTCAKAWWSGCIGITAFCRSAAGRGK